MDHIILTILFALLSGILAFGWYNEYKQTKEIRIMWSRLNNIDEKIERCKTRVPSVLLDDGEVDEEKRIH